MSNSDESRAVTHEVEIDVSIEEAWKALTEADRITAWFAPIAEVVPGPGGSITLGWGPEMTGTEKIEVWEENKRLQVVQPPSKGRVMAIDYYLESKGGKTVLRLVHSGFGIGADWDGEFDAYDKGWAIFIGNIKFYLENHSGKKGYQVGTMLMSSAGQRDAWDTLVGSGGIAEKGSLTGLGVGDTYDVVMPTGDALKGRVRVYNDPTFFSGTVENFDNALFQFSSEPMGGGTVVCINLFLYDSDPEKVNDIQSRWQAWLTALLPQKS